jgi:hypothetical protein
MAIEAFGTMAVIKLALRFLAFERWRRWLHRATRADARALPNLETATRVVRAVNRATSVLPTDVSCLPRAISVHLMLARRGHGSALQLGVNRDATGKFEAHAWVEYGGEVIIGDVPDLGRYMRLPPWPAQ